jgi:sugar lactone lactonase YvrE
VASIEVVGTQPDLLGECPVWDARIDRLYSIDIDGRCIHRFDPAAGTADTRVVGGRPGSIALTDEVGVILVALEDALVWLDWDSGTTSVWVTLDTGGPSNRLNDGAPDRSGRFWVGTMHEDAIESSGLLHRVDRDGSTETVARGIGVPNGLAFSPDGTVMYFADTLTRIVTAAQYDPTTGRRHGTRVLSDFRDLPGSPDGAAVDADGCYWIACVFGSAVARLTPDGRVDRIIDLPVDKPTRPAFGGRNLGVLFLTSIGGGGSHERAPEPGVNGMLLAIDAGARGVAEPVISRPG